MDVCGEGRGGEKVTLGERRRGERGEISKDSGDEIRVREVRSRETGEKRGNIQIRCFLHCIYL